VRNTHEMPNYLIASPVGAESLPDGAQRNTDTVDDIRTEETASPDPVRASPGSEHANGVTENAAAADLKFPLCDAAIRKLAHDTWELADAIVAECSEPGRNGVRNASHAKMKAMREEIHQNHDIDRSFERLRKLRKVAAAFPAGRRRPAVSLEAHLEAGSPEKLDTFSGSAPKGTPITRAWIRRQKSPGEEAKQEQQKAERRRQKEDQRKALLEVCRQLERDKEQVVLQKEEREQQYMALCRSVNKEPEPLSPALAPENKPSRTVAEDLEQGLRVLLAARGFDPNADNVKRAIDEFVRAVVAHQQ
jgi:transposase